MADNLAVTILQPPPNISNERALKWAHCQLLAGNIAVAARWAKLAAEIVEQSPLPVRMDVQPEEIRLPYHFSGAIPSGGFCCPNPPHLVD
jgi:hypothetical protein